MASGGEVAEQEARWTDGHVAVERYTNANTRLGSWLGADGSYQRLTGTDAESFSAESDREHEFCAAERTNVSDTRPADDGSIWVSTAV